MDKKLRREMLNEDFDHFDYPPEARCLECGEICHPKKVDYGVGRIEVHGHIINHHDWQWESDCCEAPVEY